MRSGSRWRSATCREEVAAVHRLRFVRRTGWSPGQDTVDGPNISRATSRSPEIAGGWSRFTGYFAPRIAAYDLPEMKTFMSEHPDAKVALDQLAYARGWFATYNTVGVRKALEDGVQAVLSGKATPEAAMATAQKQADELMRPYVEQTALKLPE